MAMIQSKVAGPQARHGGSLGTCCQTRQTFSFPHFLLVAPPKSGQEFQGREPRRRHGIGPGCPFAGMTKKMRLPTLKSYHQTMQPSIHQRFDRPAGPPGPAA